MGFVLKIIQITNTFDYIACYVYLSALALFISFIVSSNEPNKNSKDPNIPNRIWVTNKIGPKQISSLFMKKILLQLTSVYVALTITKHKEPVDKSTAGLRTNLNLKSKQ